jgi:class 3 adenylate cyclase
MSGPYKKNLRDPDESVRFEGVAEDIVEIGGFTIARTVQDPGWRWSRTDPRSAGALCESHHVGVVLSGRWGAELADGTLLEWGPEDVFDCPPGHDGYTLGDDPCVMIEWVGVRSFVTPRSGFGDRFLAALLFTDLVDSTSMVARIGDVACHELLSEHYHLARAELERSGGTEISTTGDGLFATFDGPAQALHAAEAMQQMAARQGLVIRAGVHVGEVTLTQDGVRGIAVHEASRIMGAAGPGEILVSEIVRALAASAGLVFEDRGEHMLKGLEGPRRLSAYSTAR